MIEIYLHVDNAYISFLSIPLDEVRRLSFRPLKWIRFVMFCICGARGHLSETPDGPPVDYSRTTPTGTEYYYKPEEDCIFIDHRRVEANEEATSSALTQPSADFRAEVIRRDGEHCVVTGEREVICDAAHIISKSKGDEYIKRVIHDRGVRYEPMSLPPNSGVNTVENGIFVNKNLHSSLFHGHDAFIKTPNFALDTEDIPRIEEGPMPSTRITLHRLRSPDYFDLEEAKRYRDWCISEGKAPMPSHSYVCGVQIDAKFKGEKATEALRPPAVILDFQYGVACYALWKSEATHAVLEKYHAEHYKDIPVPPNVLPIGTESYEYGRSGRKIVQGGVRSGHGMERAMDEMNLLLMLLHGKTPEEAARREEKRMEEEEQRSQKESREKVTEWLGGSPSKASS